MIDAIGWLLFWPGHVFRQYFVRQTIDPKRIRSILFIQLDHFGDAVLSTGLLHWLKQRFPAASLEVLCASWNQTLFESLSPADHVNVVSETRFSRNGRWHWVRSLLMSAWRLRRRRYDLAIDARGELPHAVAMWLAGAKKRVGWSGGGGGFLLTHNVKFVPRRHEIASRAAIASRIAGKVVSESDVAPQVFSRQASLRAEAQPDLSGIANGAIALHIGAGTQAKTWPAESWSKLVGLMGRRICRQILLLGGAKEQALASRILAEHQQPDHIVDLTARLSVGQLPQVFAKCAMLVGADSGPAHLATACGVPVVSLFSGTNHSAQWRPWGDQVTLVSHPVECSPCHREVCPLADHPCLQGITPERVLAEILNELDKQDRNPVGDDEKRKSKMRISDRPIGVPIA